MPIVFLRNIHEGYLSLKEADDEQNNFAAKLKNLGKGEKSTEKSFFKLLKTIIYCKKKFLITLKADYFQ